ncbi:MAG TPA: gephyrin-like molybdotransferase Glp [Devosia sp.]|nr:gephyrin-like molybdotransferase Glp [Devosia sp.]
MSVSAALSEPFCCNGEAGSGPDTLLSVDEALRRALALVEPVTQEERLPLENAHGRVLAQSVRANASLPLFDNSAMDGYAIRLADLAGEGPWRLPLAGRLAAGDAGNTQVPPGAVLRIFTGAAIPSGCDAVVIQELTQIDSDIVEIRQRPKPGENIRRVGEDLAFGAELLPAGRRIGPRAAALLASAGCGAVTVTRRVRIAYFSTGSELRPPGAVLAPGQIWNANRHQLANVLDLPWIEAIDMGSVPDQPDLLQQVLELASRQADLVVSTGGVSVGGKDHMPAVLGAAGGEIHVAKVAMKPGKPLIVGRIGTALYFGLPGNPVAAFVAWHVIGAHVAQALAGIAAAGPHRIPVFADFKRSRQPGRCEYLPVQLGSYDSRGTRSAKNSNDAGFAPRSAAGASRWSAHHSGRI